MFSGSVMLLHRPSVEVQLALLFLFSVSPVSCSVDCRSLPFPLGSCLYCPNLECPYYRMFMLDNALEFYLESFANNFDILIFVNCWVNFNFADGYFCLTEINHAIPTLICEFEDPGMLKP